MAQQRLYTEEQLRGAIKSALDGFGIGQTEDTIDIIVSNLTPIELPSDEEAGVIALKISETLKDKHTAEEEAFYLAGFQTCAKWMREQILNK